jgi:hypothetical protein
VNFRSFFAELKLRNVYKVEIAYAAIARLLMQIATRNHSLKSPVCSCVSITFPASSYTRITASYDLLRKLRLADYISNRVRLLFAYRNKRAQNNILFA